MVLVRDVAEIIDRAIIGELTLEWIGDDAGRRNIMPHPDLWLLNVKGDFLEAIETAAHWSLSSLPGNGASDFSSGTLRWNLRWQQSTEFTELTGPSLGLPVGIGCRLLYNQDLAPPENIVFTGEITREGKLKAVGDDGPPNEVNNNAKWSAVKAYPRVDTLVVFRDSPGRIVSDDTVWISVNHFENAWLVIEERTKWLDRTRHSIEKRIVSPPSLLELAPGNYFTHYFIGAEVSRETIKKRESTPNEGRANGPKGDESADPLQSLHGRVLREPGEKVVQEVEYGPPVSFHETVQNWGKTTALRGPQNWRLVLMGPPGAGKSALLRELAWQMASDDALPLYNGGQLPLLPGFLSLRDWPAYVKATRERLGKEETGSVDLTDDQALDALLLGLVRTLGAEDEDRRDWRRHITDGKALLLLDGLDEVTAHHDILKQALKGVTACPVIVTVRTVSRSALDTIGFHGDLPGEARSVYRVLNFNPANQIGFVRRVFEGDAVSERRVLDLIRQRRFAAMVGNPMSLSILCYIVQNKPALEPLPTTRTALYRETVESLIKRELTDSNQDGRDLKAWEQVFETEDIHAILEEFAYLLTRKNPATFQEQKQSFRDLVNAILKTKVTNPDSLADGLFDTAIQQLRLLNGRGRENNSPIEFLHLTFQEYLTARAMVRRVIHFTQLYGHDEGWKKVKPFLEIVSLLPTWEETLRFFAGDLANEAEQARQEERDSAPYEAALYDFLTLLEDEESDTITRDRLALAIRCLPETKPIWDRE